MKITVYTTPTCPWCAKTKEFLKQKKLSYTEKNVVEDEKARDEMIQKSHQMGVPVIDINDKIIVGFEPEEILAAVAKNSPKKAKKNLKAKRRKPKKAVKKKKMTKSKKKKGSKKKKS